MMEMLKWKAWYTGGRIFSSADKEWTELPPEGILGVVQYIDPPYRELVYGGDWYWVEDGRIWCGDTTWDGFVDPPDVDGYIIRSGRVPHPVWESVLEDMMEDREWP